MAGLLWGGLATLVGTTAATGTAAAGTAAAGTGGIISAVGTTALVVGSGVALIGVGIAVIGEEIVEPVHGNNEITSNDELTNDLSLNSFGFDLL